VDGLPPPADSNTQRSAGEKADQSRKRLRRIVWAQEGELLRAIPVTLGLMENQFAEVIHGEITEGQALVTGIEGAQTPR
jgi:hypothetical protein